MTVACPATPTPWDTTYAQLARGGETGDGCQVGVNRWGTHGGKPHSLVVRPGDLINLYISNVTYRGYSGQAARMIAVGEITPKQDDVLEMCAAGRASCSGLITGDLDRQ